MRAEWPFPFTVVELLGPLFHPSQDKSGDRGE